MPQPDAITVPASTRFPVEIEVPQGFTIDDPASWPQVEGRLEYVEGRLLWMPPCGQRQALVSLSVAHVLAAWGVGRSEIVIGANEAGMVLGGDARGADAAIWPRDDVDPRSGRYAAAAPILAVEVAGREEPEPELLEKARWYAGHGVLVVWLVLPASRQVVVVTGAEDVRRGVGERLPPHPSLPGLEPEVAAFFAQLD